MLETIREFAHEQLRASGEQTATARRHFASMLASAERAEPLLKGPRQSEVLDELERDHGNIRAALDWALAHGEAGEALRLCVALRWFWLMRSFSSEGRRWLDDALARTADVAETKHGGEGATPSELLSRTAGRELRGHALHLAGILAQNQGDLEEAVSRAGQALAIFRSLDHRAGLAKTLGALGTLAQDRGEFARANELLEEGLALRRELGDASGVGDTLLNLSMVATALGDFERAAERGRESLDVLRRLGNRHNAAAALDTLGQVAMYRSDYAGADELFEQSLLIRRELDDAHCSGSSLIHLGQLALLREQPERATALFRDSLPLLQRAGARASIAGALDGLARTAVVRERWSDAAMLFGAAEELREAGGSAPWPQESAWRETSIAAALAGLGEAEFRRTRAQGRAMSLEKVLDRLQER